MPTYRNDGTTSYRIQDTDFMPVDVHPGETVETYDRTIPSDLTLTLNTPTLEKTIHVSGEDSFTDAMTPKGDFNVSVSGEFTGTVRLIRSFDDFTTEKTVDSYTASEEAILEDSDWNAKYKVGVKAGGMTDGAVTVILSK